MGIAAASIVLSILAAQAHGLLKSHAPLWKPTYGRTKSGFFASHVRRNGSKFYDMRRLSASQPAGCA
jgi:hypothetical protein